MSLLLLHLSFFLYLHYVLQLLFSRLVKLLFFYIFSFLLPLILFKTQRPCPFIPSFSGLCTSSSVFGNGNMVDRMKLKKAKYIFNLNWCAFRLKADGFCVLHRDSHTKYSSYIWVMFKYIYSSIGFWINAFWRWFQTIGSAMLFSLPSSSLEDYRTRLSSPSLPLPPRLSLSLHL